MRGKECADKPIPSQLTLLGFTHTRDWHCHWQALMPTPQERALLLADRLFVQAPEPPLAEEGENGEGKGKGKGKGKGGVEGSGGEALQSQDDLQRKLALTPETFTRIQVRTNKRTNE